MRQFLDIKCRSKDKCTAETVVGVDRRARRRGIVGHRKRARNLWKSVWLYVSHSKAGALVARIFRHRLKSCEGASSQSPPQPAVPKFLGGISGDRHLP